MCFYTHAVSHITETSFHEIESLLVPVALKGYSCKMLLLNVMFMYCECINVLQEHTLESLQAALRAFIKDHGVCEGVMPSFWQLEEANQLDIMFGIARLGGSKQVAASMQLQFAARNPRKFETLASVVQAVQSFVQQHASAELAGDMPKSRVLRRAGQAHLSNSICRHGTEKVAKAAGLQFQSQHHTVGPVCSYLRQFRMSCGVRRKVSAIKLLPLHAQLSS